MVHSGQFSHLLNLTVCRNILNGYRSRLKMSSRSTTQSPAEYIRISRCSGRVDFRRVLCVARVDTIFLRPRRTGRLTRVYGVRFTSLHLGLLLSVVSGLCLHPRCMGHPPEDRYCLHEKRGQDHLRDPFACSGQLTVKQDYATSTVALDWEKTDRIETHQPFVLVDIANAFYGTLSGQSFTIPTPQPPSASESCPHCPYPPVLRLYR